MLSVLLFLLLTTIFLQNAPNATAAAENWLEKNLWALVLIIATNLIQFLISRKKTTSEIGKLDAETQSALIKNVHEIQQANYKLWNELLEMRKFVHLLDNAVHLMHRIDEFLASSRRAEGAQLRQEMQDLVKEVGLLEKLPPTEEKKK